MNPTPAADTDSGAGWPCGLLRVARDGRIAEVNAHLCRMLGRPGESLLGQPVEVLFSPAGRVLFQTYLLPLVRLHGRIEEFALPLQAAGRQTVETLLCAEGETGEQATEIRMVFVPYRARRAVDEELLRVRRAADAAPGVIFLFARNADGEASFPYASASIRDLYGCSPAQARDDAGVVLDRMPAEARAFFLEPGAAGDAPQRHAILRVPGPDGSIAWHEVHATVRHGRDGGHTLSGHIADVSHRHELEEQARERATAEEVRHAQGQLLGRIGHELRTPLNAILGFSELLKVDEPELLSVVQRSRIDLIEQAGQHLLALVDDVLDLSRMRDPEAGLEVRLEPVDARQVVEHGIAMAAPVAAAAGVSLKLLTRASVPKVRADERRLRQVVDNLLSNAVKYNRRGGSVCVRLLAGDSAAPGGATVTLEVEDDGPGLTPTQRRSLFQPFNRLGAESTGIPGTGLGLVISAQLVARMGGRIEVDDAPGGGCLFRVILDAVTMRAAPTDAPLRVLCIDDNAISGMVLEAILQRRPNTRLEIVRRPADGIASALRETPALLLVGGHLSEAECAHWLAEIRRHGPLVSVPVVRITGTAGACERASALKAGFDDCWQQPLSVGATLSAIDDVLTARQTLQAAA